MAERTLSIEDAAAAAEAPPLLTIEDAAGALEPSGAPALATPTAGTVEASEPAKTAPVAPKGGGGGKPSNWSALWEVPAAMLTGAVAQPISGLAGLAATALPGKEGSGAETVQKVRGALSYAPQSGAAQTVLEYAAKPFEMLKEGAGWVGEKAGSVVGAPIAGRAIGEFVGEAAPQVYPLAKGLGKLRAGAAEPSLQAKNVAAAREAGYTVPPSLDPEAGLLARATEKFAGPKSVAQAAAEKNQAVTHDLLKKDLGIPKDQPLTMEALEKVREQADKVYDDVKNYSKPIFATQKYFNRIQGLGKDLDKVLDDFPELLSSSEIRDLADTMSKAKMSPAAAVEKLRDLRSKAKINYRSAERPEKRALAEAQTEAANALEDLLDVNLRQGGKRELMKSFKDARTRIAKTYDVESALNETTGEIDPTALGRLLKQRKGQQMSGGTEQVARMARAFPGIARPPSVAFNPAWIPWRTAIAATGHPYLAGGLGVLSTARRAAGPLVTGSPYQSGALGLIPATGRYGLVEPSMMKGIGPEPTPEEQQ